MATLRIIGVPRSGTNFAKYVIEASTGIECRFHAGWWKHAVLPTPMDRRPQRRADMPTLVLFREPRAQMLAMHRFAQEATAALRGAEEFSEFLRAPVYMQPSKRATTYMFGSPLAYWMQFHFACLHWPEEGLAFVALEAARADPGVLLAAAQRLHPGQGRSALAAGLELDAYMGRNADRPLAEGWEIDRTTLLAERERDSAAAIAGLSEEDRTTILSEDVREIYADLLARAGNDAASGPLPPA